MNSIRFNSIELFFNYSLSSTRRWSGINLLSRPQPEAPVSYRSSRRRRQRKRLLLKVPNFMLLGTYADKNPWSGCSNWGLWTLWSLSSMPTLIMENQYWFLEVRETLYVSLASTFALSWCVFHCKCNLKGRTEILVRIEGWQHWLEPQGRPLPSGSCTNTL